jgi:hypothetical protein
MHLSNQLAQILFGTLIFVIPAILGFFVWRSVKNDWRGERHINQNLSLFSAIALSFNILLLYGCYVTSLLVMQGHSISEADITEYRFLLAVLWVGRIAFLISVATIITALLSEHGLARKLCIWGSAAGLIWWPFLILVDSDLVRAYLLHHR